MSGATEIIQTQATSVAATLGTKQIASLPVVGRGAFELVGYMPGVATTTGSLRDGTVNGLPQSAVNITLDGMNIQDNYAKSWDGMFTRVSPRLDAVEEVTVSTAAQGADMGSQGAAQVRFVTRSGTNRFQGSAYYYMRRERFNTNTWFNLYRNVDPVTGKPTDKARLYQDQPGARVGGPIWKDKAFFFVNYEWISSPGTNTANRTIMSPLSEQGKFQYAGGTVDLMALAAKNGHASTIDPVVAKLLADVRSTTGQGTVTTTIDPLTQTFAWAQPTESTTTYPTVRLDYNITSNHRFTGSGTYNHLVSDPDTTNSMQAIFPGFPVHGKQDSERFSWQLSMRSTLSSSMVNEVRYGATGGATLFYPDLAVADVQQRVVRRHEGLRALLVQLQGHQQPVPRFDAELARGLDDGHRGHGELAEGQARLDHRRVRHARRRVAQEPAPGADRHPRLRHRRPGRRDVQHRQLPRRVEHRHHQRPQPLHGAGRARPVPHLRRESGRRRRELQPPRRRACRRAACGRSGPSCRTAGGGSPASPSTPACATKCSCRSAR